MFERLFPSLKERAATLPPFLRDTDATLHLRTFYLNRSQPNGTLLLKPGQEGFNFARGRGAINPATRANAPNQKEYDFTADYYPPWLRPTFVRGLWFRALGA